MVAMEFIANDVFNQQHYAPYMLRGLNHNLNRPCYHYNNSSQRDVIHLITGSYVACQPNDIHLIYCHSSDNIA